MKTVLASLTSLMLFCGAAWESRATSFTYVFVPNTNASSAFFDKELASATLTLSLGSGTFQNVVVTFAAYAGTMLDPMTLTLEGTASPTNLVIANGAILTPSKTYFTNDEQLKLDAVQDGKWVLAPAAGVPDRADTRMLAAFSMAALIGFGWFIGFRRHRQFT